MGRVASIGSTAAAERARAELAGRLEDRRDEIEGAILSRIYAVSAPNGLDPTYAEGLRTAVGAAIDYGLAAIKLGEERSPPPPPALLAQARMAAHNKIGLDTVLRRYIAGHALVGDFLIEEAERDGLIGAVELQRLLRTQSTLFDRLVAAVSEEYRRAAQERPSTREQRQAERIERLLAGELLDTAGIAYDFEVSHLGAIASGEGAAEALRGLASSLDCRPLLVSRDAQTVWAWLGSRRPMDPAGLERLVSADWSPDIPLAIGEPGQGLAGWRLTHRQARAAMSIALRTPEPVIRYSEVALIASVLQDDLLVTSLRELYLKPLAQERGGGEGARKTLRAYFAADRNVSSAAAGLGVSRQTVVNRLHSIEERLGRPLEGCAAELEAILRLESLESPLPSHAAFSDG